MGVLGFSRVICRLLRTLQVEPTSLPKSSFHQTPNTGLYCLIVLSYFSLMLFQCHLASSVSEVLVRSMLKYPLYLLNLADFSHEFARIIAVWTLNYDELMVEDEFGLEVA